MKIRDAKIHFSNKTAKQTTNYLRLLYTFRPHFSRIRELKVAGRREKQLENSFYSR